MLQEVFLGECVSRMIACSRGKITCLASRRRHAGRAGWQRDTRASMDAKYLPEVRVWQTIGVAISSPLPHFRYLKEDLC